MTTTRVPPGRPTLLLAGVLIAIATVACTNTTASDPAAVSGADPATCPPGADPDAPGPSGQLRPILGPGAGTVAVDAEAGVIVAVEFAVPDGPEAGTRTWTFDLCTNTWRLMTPDRSPNLPALSRLIYDPVSGRTLALPPVTAGSIWTYSARGDAWTEAATVPGNPIEPGEPFAGDIAYDPVSASLILRDPDSLGLWSYQHRTGTWTALSQGGSIPTEAGWQQRPDGGPAAHFHSLLTLDEDLGGLVLVLLGDATHDGETWIYDLGSGAWSPRTATPPPLNTGYFEAGTEIAFDTAAGRTVVFSDGMLGVYDATADEWQTYTNLPGWPTPGDTGYFARMGGALLFDPINRRVVLVGGGYRGEQEWHPADGIWALDLATMRWVELLAPSS